MSFETSPRRSCRRFTSTSVRHLFPSLPFHRPPRSRRRTVLAILPPLSKQAQSFVCTTGTQDDARLLFARYIRTKRRIESPHRPMLYHLSLSSRAVFAARYIPYRLTPPWVRTASTRIRPCAVLGNSCPVVVRCARGLVPIGNTSSSHLSRRTLCSWAAFRRGPPARVEV